MRVSSVVFVWMFALLPAEKAWAQENAPFGLKWGISTGDAQAKGVKLVEAKISDWGKSYIATGLPKVLSDTGTVVLSFGYNDKLWRIGAISRYFDDDPNGSKVLNRYNELSSLLSEKYGKSEKLQRLDSSGLYRNENFIWGIKTGHNQWGEIFKSSNLEIELSIGAKSGSSAYWRIIFNNKSLSKEFELDKKKDEKGTL